MDPNQQAQQETQKATGANKYLQPYKSRWKILIDNFLGGIAWSLGVLIGAGLIFSVIAYFVRQVNFIPILGDFLAKVIQSAQSNIPTR